MSFIGLAGTVCWKHPTLGNLEQTSAWLQQQHVQKEDALETMKVQCCFFFEKDKKRKTKKTKKPSSCPGRLDTVLALQSYLFTMLFSFTQASKADTESGNLSENYL